MCVKLLCVFVKRSTIAFIYLYMLLIFKVLNDSYSQKLTVLLNWIFYDIFEYIKKILIFDFLQFLFERVE